MIMLLLISVCCLELSHTVGYIPDSMGLMIGLTELTMTQNQLMGDIPESLGNLTALCTLVLSHNQLSGAYPHLCAVQIKPFIRTCVLCNLRCML